jgi:hypothetical protein
MPQSPDPPVQQRLRLVRRRIAAGVLATFVAAWLAVAALGKGGSTSTATTSGSSATGTSSQSDDGASSPQSGDGSETDGSSSVQGDDGSSSVQGDDGSSGGFDTGPSQSQDQSADQGGPVTTGQS